MTGSVSTALPASGWLARLGRRRLRYFAIDGGSGAHLLTALADAHPALEAVDVPRHADLLLVVAPIAPKLVPAVHDLARALPQPARALIIDTVYASASVDDEVLPGAQRVLPEIDQILQAAFDSGTAGTLPPGLRPEDEAPPIPLPSKRQRELATELAVLSLGPVQPFTAGPLQLLLVCDGEQIVTARVEAGYAERKLASVMTNVDWRAATTVAARLDPLAPIAGQLAFVSALEQLQGTPPPAGVAQQRMAALALERAQNHVAWFVRFARLIVHQPLAIQAAHLARTLSVLRSQRWPESPRAWIAPQRHAPEPDRHAVAALTRLSAEVSSFAGRVERDRLLALRTRGIGVLSRERIAAAGVTGPVRVAGNEGVNDVRGRLLTRLRAAGADLETALGPRVAQIEPPSMPLGDVPAGEAHVAVEGPRGQIGLHLVSAGNDRAAAVAWQRPSAALLSLIPDILAGEKLADAEVILASLDLAMAEADG